MKSVNKKRNKKANRLLAADLAALILLPLTAAILGLLLRLDFITFTLLFYGPLAVYLSIRTPGGITRAALFSALLMLPGGLFGDYLAVSDNAWHVPTVFPFRLFGAVPVEDLVWGVLSLYVIVIYFEHFFDKGKHTVRDPYLKYLAYIVGIASLVFTTIIVMRPELLRIPYVYLVLGILTGIAPIAAILRVHHSIVIRFLKTMPYFVGLFFVNELTALMLGHWSFPGNHFIGWVTILGQSLPLEELVLFVALWPAVAVTYFVFFDDRKHIDISGRQA